MVSQARNNPFYWPPFSRELQPPSSGRQTFGRSEVSERIQNRVSRLMRESLAPKPLNADQIEFWKLSAELAELNAVYSHNLTIDAGLRGGAVMSKKSDGVTWEQFGIVLGAIAIIGIAVIGVGFSWLRDDVAGVRTDLKELTTEVIAVRENAATTNGKLDQQIADNNRNFADLKEILRANGGKK